VPADPADPADPAARAAYALLADGSTVEIRAAGPADAGAIQQMHEQMSPGNAYFRFFSFSPQAPEREALRLTRPPGPDHAALLARLGGKLIGVASYEPTVRLGVAEIAFAVSDEMHGRGVATLLLEHLVSLARRRGLLAFAAETLPENIAMQRVFADAGLHVERRFTDGVIELIMPLPGRDGERFESYLEAVSGRASRADVASLRHLLQPASVAVIGASRARGSVGREVLHNIVAGGFAGQVFPVNPSGAVIEGLVSLTSAAELPEGTDLAVVAVPAAEVPAVAEQCGQRGVHVLIVITAGFDSRAGAALLAICRRYGMRLVGPNCFGALNTAEPLNATFSATTPSPGSAGIVVQSGGMGVALLEHVERLGIGVSSFASVGDKYDVSSNDLLTWWERDGQTTMALLYLESFGNPRQFAHTARRVGQQFPVLTVIGGRSAAGQRAAASQPAASATPLVTQEALFGQAGIIATESFGELIEAAALLSCQPRPAGRRIGIVSSAAGAGVLAADACVDAGLQVTVLSADTQQRLAALLPPGATVSGPVDTTAAVTVPDFRACLQEVAADASVDALLAIGVPTAVADLGVAILTADVGKPMAAALLDRSAAVSVIGRGASHPKGQSGGPGETVPAARVPVYGYPESAARALARAAAYEEWRGREHGQVPRLEGVDTAGARALVADFLAGSGDGGWLDTAATGWLLGCYQIPVTAGTAAGTSDGRSIEVRIGVLQEPTFGPLVTFGPGGVASEVVGGRSARLAPLTDVDAAELIRTSRAAPLLGGPGGSLTADTSEIAGLLLRVSRLADDLPEVAELELDPVIARAGGTQVAVARIRLAPAVPRDPFLRQLR